ncbi:MAG: hypothetical protein VKM92_00305 [Cyanobacteriota bacterium]|nr:hypothetical protein [Cyanobacteriota bacterium]
MTFPELSGPPYHPAVINQWFGFLEGVLQVTAVNPAEVPCCQPAVYFSQAQKRPEARLPLGVFQLAQVAVPQQDES